MRTKSSLCCLHGDATNTCTLNPVFRSRVNGKYSKNQVKNHHTFSLHWEIYFIIFIYVLSNKKNNHLLLLVHTFYPNI